MPFKDFFDPGYFLSLYASALLIRIAGDNLFGEVVLNVLAVAAGLLQTQVERLQKSRETQLLQSGGQTVGHEVTLG